MSILRGRAGSEVDAQVEFQGGLVRVKFRDFEPKEVSRSGMRKPVTAFTSKSRLALLRLVSRLKHDAPALFITLTYRQNMRDHKAAKRHLDLALRWLTRKLPRSAILWRMEYQRRGAIHFHLVAFDAYGLPLGEFTSYWQKMTGDDSYPDVKFVQGGRRRLLAYVSKYIAKAEPGLDNATNSEILSETEFIGRYWGVFHRAFLPLAERFQMSIIHTGVFFAFRRFVRRYLKGSILSVKFGKRFTSKFPTGFSLFVGDASAWYRLFGDTAVQWYEM
jgi:hypothetical protein